MGEQFFGYVDPLNDIIVDSGAPPAIWDAFGMIDAATWPSDVVHMMHYLPGIADLPAIDVPFGENGSMVSLPQADVRAAVMSTESGMPGTYPDASGLCVNPGGNPVDIMTLCGHYEKISF